MSDELDGEAWKEAYELCHSMHRAAVARADSLEALLDRLTAELDEWVDRSSSPDTHGLAVTLREVLSEGNTP